jgi:Flp pilus assembly protein TadD
MERPDPDLEAAQAAYQQVIDLAPLDTSAHRELAKLQQRRGRFKEALLTLRRLQEIAPQDPEPWSMAGALYLREGQHKKAIHAFHTALQLDPKDVAARHRLARALLRVNEVVAAREQVDAAWRVKPEDPEVQAVLAEVKMADQDWAGARLALETASRLAPNHPRVREAQARLLVEQADKEKGPQRSAELLKAVAHLEVATKADPDDRDAALYLAQTLYRAGSYPDAETRALQAATRWPDDLGPRLLLISIRLKVGDAKGAATTARAVYERGSHREPWVLFALGREKEVEGQVDQAIEMYERAVAEDRRFLDGQRRLIHLYLGKKKMAAAIDAYELVVGSGSATLAEKVDLAELYANTGLNTRRGMVLINEALGAEPKNLRYLAIKKKLAKGGTSGKRTKRQSKGPQVIRLND